MYGFFSIFILINDNIAIKNPDTQFKPNSDIENLLGILDIAPMVAAKIPTTISSKHIKIYIKITIPVCRLFLNKE